MNRILITGASGNVGIEVVEHLLLQSDSHKVVLGLRMPENDNRLIKLISWNTLKRVKFDFEDPSTFKPALTSCDVLFLLRPPQISSIDKVFKPLISEAKSANVKHIVFLSVQGVQNSKFIPHHKIEKLIVQSGIPYTFLRPAYFMQNLTTTLRKELVEKRRIYLPAGTTRFTLIDTADIGLVAALVLADPLHHMNRSYELTSNEKLSFSEMAVKISSKLNYKIKYESPGPVSFFLQKKREHMPVMYIPVMIMLHFLPRFGKEPDTTDTVYKLTGKPPVTFDEFVSKNRLLLMGS